MQSYQAAKFNINTIIATTDGTITLVAAPGAGRTIAIQRLVINITTAAAQTFTITGGSVNVFSAPASLPQGVWLPVDCLTVGKPVTANSALQFVPAAAGVGATITGFGYYLEG